MENHSTVFTEIIETLKDLIEILKMPWARGNDIFLGDILLLVKLPIMMFKGAGRMWTHYGKRLGAMVTIPFIIMAVIGITSGAHFYYAPAEETLFPQFFCDNLIIKAIIGAIAVYVINRISIFNLIFNFFFSYYFLEGILPVITDLDDRLLSVVNFILAILVLCFTLNAKCWYYDLIVIEKSYEKQVKEKQAQKEELEKAKKDPNYRPKRKKGFDIGDVAIDAIKNSINKRKNKKNSKEQIK